MNSYNKRLDELMPCDCKFLKGFAWRKGDPCEGCINGRLKQAIISLTKELVAEAKPEVKEVEKQIPGDMDSFLHNQEAIWSEQYVTEFEQNLLKALETQE